ncbi:Holliday junction branch migration protein RuvA [Govanella unica]|uniref:Holliday junction branch migration complex subunit RuvA n=1 Tax=Govanella unica TaxID=2975056 RepID=A0A9X3TZX7_9PROT|nr:Holliday junction branch migration protein RuvA [Govania unica]
MIAKLKGIVDSTGEDWVILDVNGVGYLVFCSGRTLARLPGAGGAASLVIVTHVREDHIHLYGFLNAAERDWFGLLQTVQGIGARVALGILSVLAPDELAQAIAAQDKTAVARANGVGRKLAERVVNELKDKVGALAVASGLTLPQAATADSGGNREVADAVSALTNLGYRPADAFAAVARAAKDMDAGAGLQALIKAGLKELAP